MAQYFKNTFGQNGIELSAHFAFHGLPVMDLNNVEKFPIRERVFFNEKYPSLSNYSIENWWSIDDDHTPCTRQEFEEAKAAALAAIASLMDAENEVEHLQAA